MKLFLDDLTKADFGHGSRIMKKSSQRGEISAADCAYLAALLISLIMKSPSLEAAQIQQLDVAMGVVMGFQS